MPTVSQTQRLFSLGHQVATVTFSLWVIALEYPRPAVPCVVPVSVCIDPERLAGAGCPCPTRAFCSRLCVPDGLVKLVTCRFKDNPGMSLVGSKEWDKTWLRLQRCRVRVGVVEMGGERWKIEARVGSSLLELS